MLWFSLSLAAAFLAATESAALKKLFGDLRTAEMACIPLVYPLPLLAALLAFLPGVPLDRAFWGTMLWLAPLNMLASLLFTAAIRQSPLSLTIPFVAFTPVFTMGTGYLLLGERLSPWGVAGILTVVAGSYILNLDAAGRDGVLGPFRAMVRERGSLLMFATSIIWALTSVGGKQLILRSSPLYAAAVFFLIHNTAMFLLLTALGRVRPRAILSRPRAGVLLGLISMTHIVCHFQAVSLVQVAYMISVKRLMGLFAVLYGGLVFHETEMRSRLAGAGLMSVGSALIGLAG